MNLEHDLARIALQEARLQFQRFDADSAWALGTRLRTLAERRQAAVAIEIHVSTDIPCSFARCRAARPTISTRRDASGTWCCTFGAARTPSACNCRGTARR